MTLFKWLNNLLFVENLLGIYRSYSDEKKLNKCFIIFQIFIQTVLHTIFITLEVYYVLHRNEFSEHINIIYCSYAISAYITAMPVVATGIYYSRAFKSYVRSINRVSERFKDDIQLINAFKKIYGLSATIMPLFTVFAIYRSLSVLTKYTVFLQFLIVASILASQSILRITTLFQFLMFFVVTMIVFVLSERSTSLISVVNMKQCSRSNNSDEECDITREQIQEWVELYRDLANCCVQVTLCFGRQFFFSLISALVYYLLLTYQICYVNPFNNKTTEEYKDSVIIIFSYLSILIMPLIAGQKTSNQGLKFQRQLVRLYNTMIVYDSKADEAKMVKDFIRLIKKNPIEVKLLSNIPAGMYMLPVILTLAVNYFIVMMQFTHVV